MYWFFLQHGVKFLCDLVVGLAINIRDTGTGVVEVVVRNNRKANRNSDPVTGV
ncbi:hypothetical protein BgiMline_011068, partial [Biomphalaria glabrata]